MRPLKQRHPKEVVYPQYRVYVFVLDRGSKSCRDDNMDIQNKLDYYVGETMNEVTTYYLEMKSPSSLKEKTESNGLHVHECEIKQFQVNRFFYQLHRRTLGMDKQTLMAR